MKPGNSDTEKGGDLFAGKDQQGAEPVKFDDRLADGEAWLARRIWLKELFAGLSTPESRREFIRRRIVELRLQQVIAGRLPDKTLVTFTAAFQRLYGTSLEG